MLNANPYQQYQQNAIKGASRGDLTLMLYNGSHQVYQTSNKTYQGKNIPESHNAVVRAQEIISHLSNTLNMEYRLSSNLASIYEYINRRIMEGNIKKEVMFLAEALDLVEELRNTWQRALKQARADVVAER